MSAKICFRKELASNIFMVHGKAAPFVAYEGNRGLLELEDTPANEKLIEALQKAASEQRGGIVAISNEEAEEFKKKENLQTTPVKPWLRDGAPRLAPTGQPTPAPATQPEAAPAAANGKAPIRPTAIEQITMPPPEAGFKIAPPPAPAPVEPSPDAPPPPRFKPETKRVQEVAPPVA